MKSWKRVIRTTIRSWAGRYVVSPSFRKPRPIGGCVSRKGPPRRPGAWRRRIRLWPFSTCCSFLHSAECPAFDKRAPPRFIPIPRRVSVIMTNCLALCGMPNWIAKSPGTWQNLRHAMAGIKETVDMDTSEHSRATRARPVVHRRDLTYQFPVYRWLYIKHQ